MPKKITPKEIEQKMLEKHNSKYSYDLSNYINTRSEISIICPSHGTFLQKVSDHLYSGCGCPKCDVTRKLTTEDFVLKSRLIHGDKYDYELSEYGRNNYDKVTITCKIHGNFEQTPWAHMRGQGCPECANNRQYDTEEYIKLCKEKHQDLYDYSLVEYTGKNSYIKVICKKHGEFEQLARLHLNGYGCKKCRMSKLEIWVKQFLDERKIKWEYNKKFDLLKHKKHLTFDFWLPDYNICIECDGIQHHQPVDFFGGQERFEDQQTKDYLKEEWCRHNGLFLLRIDNFENPFSKLKSIVIDKYTKHIVEEKKSLPPSDKIRSTNFDIDDRHYHELVDYISRHAQIENNFELEGESFIKIVDTNLLIKYVDYFHYSEVNTGKKALINIYNIANNNGYKVVQVFEDDWKFKRNIIESRILNLLSKSSKIWARKTEVRFIDDFKIIRDFMNDTHIQGYVPSKYKIGIFYNNEMVGLLTLSDLRINLGQKKEVGTFEILRYSCKNGVNIIGGFDKALKFFIRTYNPNKIVSYANRMWSNEDNVYSKIGMKLESISDASYFYIVGDKREGRFSYRKDVLLSKYGYPSSMTEHTIMLSNSVYRIFDAGCFKYVMTL